MERSRIWCLACRALMCATEEPPGFNVFDRVLSLPPLRCYLDHVPVAPHPAGAGDYAVLAETKRTPHGLLEFAGLSNQSGLTLATTANDCGHQIPVSQHQRIGLKLGHRSHHVTLILRIASPLRRIRWSSVVWYCAPSARAALDSGLYKG